MEYKFVTSIRVWIMLCCRMYSPGSTSTLAALFLADDLGPDFAALPPAGVLGVAPGVVLPVCCEG